MRSTSLFHLTLGALVVLIAGAAGQIANLERRPAVSDPDAGPRYRCRAPQARYPCSSSYAPTWHMTAVPQRETRVIVQYRTGRLTERLIRELMSPGTLSGAPQGSPAFDLRTFDMLPGLGVIGFSSDAQAAVALDRLRRDDRVEYAELDAVWHVDQVGRPRGAMPNDARFADQWGLENTGQPVNGHPAGTPGVDIDAPNAWTRGHGSEDVVVAVIDSGVDYRHEDLAANMWVNPGEIPDNGIDDDGNGVVDDVHGFNAIDGSGDPDDDLGHGSHVAGIIGAVGDNGTGVAGVNWTTRIMALKFLGPTGGGTTSDAIACINYILEMKARGANVRVVNCSWGSTSRSEALGDAIDRASKLGILFVCASGNDGVDTDRVPHYPSSYDTDGVVSVAALAPNDTLAGFSNWGLSSVDVAAPGVDILSTLPDGRYGFASGTSMASPFVAGVAALVASENPKMPNSEIRERVLGGAHGVPDFAKRLVTGGRLSGSGAFGE
jgi:subtilisin family serine protease